MARPLSMQPHGCAVDGGAGLSLTRLVTFAPAVVVALALTMAALGGAFIGRQGWTPTWGTITEDTMSHPSSDRVGPGENDLSRSARAASTGAVQLGASLMPTRGVLGGRSAGQSQRGEPAQDAGASSAFLSIK